MDNGIDLIFAQHAFQLRLITHITAHDWASLGFGQGYAIASLHLCEVEDQIVRIRSERARCEGSKLRRSAASITAALVCADSSPRPFRAREAVDAETPAYSATSASVASRPVLKRLRKRLRR